jgi:hypothetical protein
MRLTRLAAAILIVGLTTSKGYAQQQFQLFASVVDTKTGAPPASVAPEDFVVKENGADLKVVQVEPVEWPTKVQLLVDNGIGLGAENIMHLRNGVKGFIEALPDGTEVTIFTTAPQARTLVKPTTDKAMLLDGIGRIAPDGGAGRFTESLNEATQRIEKDKNTNQFPVVVVAGTTSGDNNIMERDVQNMMQRLQKRPATIHVILLNSKGGSGGANQTNVGIAMTQMTGGRYEAIAAPSRLATLLPEIGQQVAKSQQKQSHQFRLTVERPSGAKGDPGEIGFGVRTGLRAEGLSRDGRLP